MKQFSVTQVLSPFNNFHGIDPVVLQKAADRGTTLHAAYAAYAKGLFFRIPSDYKPYFECFRKWFDSYVEKALFVEMRWFDKQLHFNGQVDLVAMLKNGKIALVDYKNTYSEQPTWKAQIAAYKHLIEHNHAFRVDQAMCLCIGDGGGDALAKVYENSNIDFAGFLSALTAYRYFKG